MYKLKYSPFTGKVESIERITGGNIPICEGNADYQDFLIWNKAQKTPLDLNSTIEMVLPTSRDLAKEIDEIKIDIAALKKK